MSAFDPIAFFAFRVAVRDRRRVAARRAVDTSNRCPPLFPAAPRRTPGDIRGRLAGKLNQEIPFAFPRRRRRGGLYFLADAALFLIRRDVPNARLSAASSFFLRAFPRESIAAERTRCNVRLSRISAEIGGRTAAIYRRDAISPGK